MPLRIDNHPLAKALQLPVEIFGEVLSRKSAEKWIVLKGANAEAVCHREDCLKRVKQFSYNPVACRRMERLALGLDAGPGWRLAPIHPH